MAEETPLTHRPLLEHLEVRHFLSAATLSAVEAVNAAAGAVELSAVSSATSAPAASAAPTRTVVATRRVPIALPALPTITPVVRTPVAPAAVAPIRPALGFQVFDATQYESAPDLSSAGVSRLTLTADGFTNADGAVDESATRALARRAAAVGSAGGRLVLDVQDWALDVRDTPAATVDANVATLRQVIGWLKSERPGLQVGVYGALPLADWSAPADYANYTGRAATSEWAAEKVPAATAARAAWQAANARLAALGQAVDFVAPSLDTWYDDPAGWGRFAEGTLAEARKYAKPVVPVINRDIRETSKHAGQAVSDEFWAQQRTMVAARADGVILAGGAGQAWNPAAGWWRSTEAFARSLATPGALADGAGLGPFWVEDQTDYLNFPSLGESGLSRQFYFTGGEVWADYWVRNEPDEATVRQLARKVDDMGKMLVLDIEHWPLDIRTNPKAVVDANITKFVHIAEWLKDERPELKIGFYGVAPIRDYWTPANYYAKFNVPVETWWRDSELAKYAPQMEQWRAANDYLRPITDRVDVIVSSLYTFYNEPGPWQDYAKGNLEEAKRYGKPVLAVLQPIFPYSTPLGGQFIDGAFFGQQLEATKRLGAAAVTIWGGGANFNPADGWWQATQAFVHSLPTDGPAAGPTHGLDGSTGASTPSGGGAAAIVDAA